ncbi:YebC/PmpR family DNA-binding transcriptional regulator [Christensenellaceae bacterium NSJ-63]|uniref:Probable transcriptional regulatory protein H8693_01735 n=1 Tax=Guopingia tenuis TaxID=2763656 RepID=A0A926HW51_9FIRM|nr:YebC/PmpR family DNA-binding transcriptional regulator [Guopingia tenuis]MBC8537650.1 YebC/PmpR family DNA-binding transcriptional regulator [Guopingia tenuis]
MSGHSKWSTIKRKKEKTDAKKGKIFTKIGREIAVAVKQGGPDPDTNSRLRDCIAKAKANNMPNDNIARSIKKASGELGNINYEEITYEGYGANGVAVIVEVLTDNRNRTAADVRHALTKGGGSLGANGCVSWMFDKKGVIEIEDDGSIDEDELMMTAIDAGADDFSSEDGVFTVLTDPAGFSGVREALEKAGYEFLSADIDMVPQNMVEVNAEQADSIYKLLDLLEDNDDVQNVYHNANLPEEEE